jgi:NitT/TauT family transport system ATP-binding protein
VIEIRNAGKTFVREGRRKAGQDFRAVDGVDLTVKDNEFITLLGPSGCGKTTLLRMIAGLVDGYDGEIVVDGAPVTGPSPSRAMVFQSFALLPWANVLRNVAFGLELQGVKKAERMATAQRLVELVGLAGFENSLPRELSGGMKQRVGLARALAVKPEVLLMDEPFGALDEQTKWIMQEELLRIWEEEPKTVLFVTHSIDEAILLADRVVVMASRPGRVARIEDVNLPRPRTRAVESLPEFSRLRDSLWRELKEQQRGAADSAA